MTAASAIAAPTTGSAVSSAAASVRAAAVANATGDDAFGAMVTASTNADGEAVDQAKAEAAPPKIRRVSTDATPPTDEAKPSEGSDEPPANLLTGAALFVPTAPPPAPTSSTETAASSTTAAPQPAAPTAPLPAAAEPAVEPAAAEQVAQPDMSPDMSKGPKQAASIALAAGLARLLRPTAEAPVSAPAPGAAVSGVKDGNASTAKAGAAAPVTMDDKQAAPFGSNVPPATGQAATPDAASGAPTPQPAAAPTPASDAKPDAAPAPAAAGPPALAQTPSAAPGLTASLSSLSHATIETTAQIAAQITRQLNGRSTRFEMGLTPEGLGRVDVRLDIDADGRLTARLAFDNPLAATDLRGRADELRGQLQDAGFKLSQDALSFAQRDPSGDGNASNPRQNRAFAAASRVGADADVEAAPAVSPWISLSLAPRGVDMKV